MYTGFATADPRFIVLCPEADAVDEINDLREGEMKKSLDKTWRTIGKMFPQSLKGSPPFTAREDEYGQILIKLINQKNAK